MLETVLLHFSVQQLPSYTAAYRCSKRTKNVSAQFSIPDLKIARVSQAYRVFHLLTSQGPDIALRTHQSEPSQNC
jgi:hypothetical protein